MLPVPVRVGQAVDVVAQAGRPKSITGERSPSLTSSIAMHVHPTGSGSVLQLLLPYFSLLSFQVLSAL